MYYSVSDVMLILATPISACSQNAFHVGSDTIAWQYWTDQKLPSFLKRIISATSPSLCIMVDSSTKPVKSLVFPSNSSTILC